MKRRGFWILLVTVLWAGVSASADANTLPASVADEEGDAVAVLKRVERNLASLGTYRVLFEYAADTVTRRGEYIVSGSDFYWKDDEVEIYTDNGLRYEVNVAKREVVVDKADGMRQDFMNNPALGLSSLLDTFDAKAVEGGGATMIILTSKSDTKSRETIFVAMDEAGRYPSEIVYGAGDGGVAVRLVAIESLSSGLPHFDVAKYEGYEIIDFR